MTDERQKVLKEMSVKRRIDVALKKLIAAGENMPKEIPNPCDVPKKPLILEFPAWYTFNNPPQFYTDLKSIIESGKDFHLLFTGKTGTGKTVLAKLIRQLLLDHYQMPIFQWIQCSEYYLAYKKTWSLRGDDARIAAHEWEHEPLRNFVMDDLGTGEDTETSKSFFNLIIDRNYRQILERKSRFTIITTNLGSEGITERYGSRTMYRLLENYHIFKFDPYNFRKAKAIVHDYSNTQQQEI